jgi:hypothetical protein
MARYTGPAMMSSSQLEKRHPKSLTAYEDRVGPSAGPRVATAAHRATANGNSAMVQMSPSDAPAVARQGEAMTERWSQHVSHLLSEKECYLHPKRKRNTIRPAKLSTSAVGMHRMMKKKPDIAYGGFLPMAGTSDNGEKSKHPIP